MYRKQQQTKTMLDINESVEGETIEQKMERVVNNNEAITDGAPIAYTERKEGVLPGYDIRTDRFAVALDAMDKVTASKLSSREEKGKIVPMDKEKNKENQGGNSGTEGGTEGGK